MGWISKEVIQVAFIDELDIVIIEQKPFFFVFDDADIMSVVHSLPDVDDYSEKIVELEVSSLFIGLDSDIRWESNSVVQFDHSSLLVIIFKSLEMDDKSLR